MKVKHKLEYGLLRTVIFGLNLPPVSVILFFCSTLGYLAWVIFPFRLNVAYKNISTVYPEMEHTDKLKLLRKIYIQFTRTFGLVFILHRRKMFKLIENAVITGRDKVDKALQEGRGVILTTIHASWFEAYFAWFNHTNLPTTLIYQKQSNPLADDYFVKQRSRYGTSLEHISSWEGMKEYQKALSANRLLIISLDQSYTSRGTSIMFFNRPLACAKGTAMLHLRTGAPVLTSVYYVKDGKLHIDFDEVHLPRYDSVNEESIQDISRRAIQPYEAWIRQYPEQWFSLFHRLWSKKGYEPVKRTFSQIFL